MRTPNIQNRSQSRWPRRLVSLTVAALCVGGTIPAALSAGAVSGRGSSAALKSGGDPTCTWTGTPRKPTPVYLITSDDQQGDNGGLTADDLGKLQTALGKNSLLELQSAGEQPSLWVIADPGQDSTTTSTTVAGKESPKEIPASTFDNADRASFLVPLSEFDTSTVGLFGWGTDVVSLSGDGPGDARKIEGVLDGKLKKLDESGNFQRKERDPSQGDPEKGIRLDATYSGQGVTSKFPVVVSNVEVDGKKCTGPDGGEDATRPWTFPVIVTYSGFPKPADGKSKGLDATVLYDWTVASSAKELTGAKSLEYPALPFTTPAEVPKTNDSKPADSKPNTTVKPEASGSGSKSSPLGVILAGVVGLVIGAAVMAAVAQARQRRNQGGSTMGHAYGAGNGPADGGSSGGAYPSPPAGPGGPAAPDTPWGTGAASAAALAGAGAAVPTVVRSGGASTSPGVEGWTAATPGGSAIRLEDITVARISPTQTSHGRVWSIGSPNYAGTAGWLEKREGKGEDAEPTMRFHASGRSLIGVYDGTGGSGAAVARTTNDGRELSAAYVAARLTRDVVESWYADAVAEGDRALETAGLAATLGHVLEEEARHLPSKSSAVRGKLHRVLPTTMACLAFDVADPSATIDAIWAGDSRCFQLTAEHGLQVLTKDDTRETDALALIRNDQPMENLVAADRPFRVNHRRFTPESPVVLIAATDGAFGYVRTPAHFEYLVLHTLADADSLSGWSAALLAAFSEFVADDVSFAIAAAGFDSFASLKAAMQARHDYLQSQHWDPFVAQTGEADAIEKLREESWSVYRDLYHSRLESPEAPVPASARPAGQ